MNFIHYRRNRHIPHPLIFKDLLPVFDFGETQVNQYMATDVAKA